MNNQTEWDQLVNFQVIDTWDYIEALKTFLPKATDEQILFLWNRSQKEKHGESGDVHERRFFGDYSMAEIAPYISSNDAKNILSTFDITDIQSESAMAVTLLCLSKHLDEEDRMKFTKYGWDLALRQHKDNNRFRQAASQLSPEFAWSELEKYMEKLETNDISGWLDEFAALSAIAINIPTDKITTAAKRICKFFGTGAWPQRKAELISNMVSNAPEALSDTLWEEIFDSILNLQQTHEFQKIYETAAELIIYMPEEIRPGKFSRIVSTLKKNRLL